MEFKSLFGRKAEAQISVSPEELKLAEMVLAARGVVGQGAQRETAVSAVCQELKPQTGHYGC